MALKENLEIFEVKQALSFMDKDPENNLPRLLDWFDRFDRKDTLKTQREVIRKAVADKDNNWHQLVMSLWKDIDPGGAQPPVREFYHQWLSAGISEAAGKPGKIQLQYSLGDPAGSHQCLQSEMYRMLGGRIWKSYESDL